MAPNEAIPEYIFPFLNNRLKLGTSIAMKHNIHIFLINYLKKERQYGNKKARKEENGVASISRISYTCSSWWSRFRREDAWRWSSCIRGRCSFRDSHQCQHRIDHEQRRKTNKLPSTDHILLLS